MVQGRSKPFILSIIAHLAIILALIYSKPEVHLPPVAKESAKPLTSYLYTPKTPTKVTQTKKLTKQEKIKAKASVKAPEKKLSSTKPSQQNEQQKVAPASVPEVPAKPVKQADLPLSPLPTENTSNSRVITSTKSDQTISINPLKQLENIRQSIDKATIKSELAERFQHHSLSSMHPNPAAVPKSVIPLTRDEMKNKNTQQLSGSLSITKTDDGVCVITEDLSSVGIEGVKATSVARCGITKMQRRFRDHMKKVTTKFQPLDR